MEYEGSLLSLQKPAPEPDETRQYFHTFLV
jgi:hypothetical protein